MSLATAQILFAHLKAGNTEDFGGPEFMVYTIRNELRHEGASLEALETQRKVTAEDIERELREAVVKKLISEAQDIFKQLIEGDLSHYENGQTMAVIIRGKLNRAGADCKVLDPEWAEKKTAENMEVELDLAAKRADLFNKFNIGFGYGRERE